MKRFDASLPWLMERIQLRDAEIDRIRHDDGIGENERSQVLRAKRAKSIADVLEEVEVLVDTHFFNEFWETKTSSFLKKVIENQSSIEVRLFKRTWQTMN